MEVYFQDVAERVRQREKEFEEKREEEERKKELEEKRMREVIE